MIGFEPTEEQRLIVENVSAFARDRLRAAARDHEQRRAFDPSVLQEAHDLGLTTLDLPTSVGGGGLGLLDAVLVEEVLGWGDPCAPLAFRGAHALGCVARELGDEAAVARTLGDFSTDAELLGAFAWSEAKPAAHEGFSTTARPDGDGWVIDGAKRHVLHADGAHRIAVAAQIDASAGWNGLGVFVVDARAPGVTVGARHATLGLDAASFGALTLTAVRVSHDARLGSGDVTAALLRAFGRISLVNAARCVGLARAALELALAYCQDRTAFGKPIGHFQAVAFTLADRAMDVESASLMVRRAAAEWDAGRYDPALVASASALAQRVAVTTADNAVLLHGGAGFMRDYLPEKLLRDARTLSLYGVSAATSDQVVAACELGAPLTGALCLPTPDLQPVMV